MPDAEPGMDEPEATDAAADRSTAPDADPGATPVVGAGALVVDLDWRTSAAFVLGLLGLLAVFSAATSARQTLIWVAVGVLLALALDPVVGAIQRGSRCRRSVAVALVLVIVVGVFGSVLLLLGPPAVREARAFRDDLPRVVSQLGSLPVVGPTLERNDAPQALERWLQDLPSQLSGNPEPLTDLARGAFGGALAATAVALVTITLLLDGHRLLDGASRVLPARHRQRADEVFDVLYRTVGRYFAGSLLIAVMNGLFILVAGLSLGVPLAPLAAVWAMTTNLLPQIGGFLGGSVFVTLGFTQGAGTGVLCLVVFLLYQQFENHVLQPTVVGQAVDLSPPVTMMATLIGASAAGVPGALVAVPLVGTAKVIARAARRTGDTPAGEPGRPAGPPALRRWSRPRRHGEV